MSTPADRFRRSLATLSLSQNGAGRFFGTDPRNVRRWADGSLPIPYSVELLLATMIAHDLSVPDVVCLAEVYLAT